ncbi:TauD/TfdA family dioxygenase [Rhodococcus koreensis]|uniref:Taurine catabolism dioxygenase TauD, TfdA family n=1 Tax=Rhodococcus koreensis TaxID=99653 RepID=A0A1H5F5Q8_9NOCA|nr:TauD/TfdA family dioxygenase [Rhodococcus koreensis]SED98787.1 Taurine catabolism dioxygenase TauD, TfdA family [Rhodococcus koreensis]
MTGDRIRLKAFLEQSEEFLESARTQFPDAAKLTIPDVLMQEPRPLTPVWIDNPDSPTREERRQIEDDFFGPNGVAHFAYAGERSKKTDRHQLFALAEQLNGRLPLAHAVDHPMEQHPQARMRFGPSDGTLKIYNLPIPLEVDKYREVAESKELFAAHNDGLGYAGAVSAAMLVLDSAPAWGGYTCFQQFIRLAIALANSDARAFRALFTPDAIVAVRPRGKGAIRVASPVLYVNDHGHPQTFFRIGSGEYQISWRKDLPALNQARELLVRLAQPFAPSSTFVHMMHPGQGVLIRNPQVIHSRTAFEDDVYGTQRVLARKWFVASAADSAYKHVPGMNVHPRYSRLYPEYFAPEYLSGEWHFDQSAGRNVRIG